MPEATVPALTVVGQYPTPLVAGQYAMPEETVPATVGQYPTNMPALIAVGQYHTPLVAGQHDILEAINI